MCSHHWNALDLKRSVNVPGEMLLSTPMRSIFAFCKFLSRFTFSPLSSLTMIGVEAFCSCAWYKVRILSSIVELSQACFLLFERLYRVAFCEFSVVKRVGFEAFRGCSSDVRSEYSISPFALCGRFQWLPSIQSHFLPTFSLCCKLRIPITASMVCLARAHLFIWHRSSDAFTLFI